MLDIVETPVVCNYDVDVIFDKEIYKKCEDLILSNQFFYKTAARSCKQ